MELTTARRGVDGELRRTILTTAAYMRRINHKGMADRSCLIFLIRHLRPEMSWQDASAALWFVLRQ